MVCPMAWGIAWGRMGCAVPLWAIVLKGNKTLQSFACCASLLISTRLLYGTVLKYDTQKGITKAMGIAAYFMESLISEEWDLQK